MRDPALTCGDGETVDYFVTAFYALAELCNNGLLHGELIIDRLVVGLADMHLLEWIDKYLMLERAIEMAWETKVAKLPAR